jgi:hypothetical protein
MRMPSCAISRAQSHSQRRYYFSGPRDNFRAGQLTAIESFCQVGPQCHSKTFYGRYSRRTPQNVIASLPAGVHQYALAPKCMLD